MKISRLIYLAEVVFALIASSYSGNAQNRKMDNSATSGNNRSIVNSISGLTTSQQDQIRQMENGYQLVMNDLRTQMQSTANQTDRTALRNEMQEITQSHQNNIKRLLTKDQKREYNKLLAENRTTTTSQGRGKGQGKGSGGMRGGGQGKRY